MNAFDMIGPVMIGPSSSHTAGACRLGRVVNRLIGSSALSELRIQLSGSFARTGRGHGTERALLAGVMGYNSWSEEIRTAAELAEQRGIRYEFLYEDIPGAHPNTARIEFHCADGRHGELEGASIGGGNIRVNSIDGLQASFTGESNTLLVLHKDRPGVIAAVTNLMYWGYGELNIGSFFLSRKERGGSALMTIELDAVPPDALMDELCKIEHVENALLIRELS